MLVDYKLIRIGSTVVSNRTASPPQINFAPLAPNRPSGETSLCRPTLQKWRPPFHWLNRRFGSEMNTKP